MATEASKTRAIWNSDVLDLLQGDGIDIGCGMDPILPFVDKFDQSDGDANQISQFVKKKYDFVFSSHSLEHMRDVYSAFVEWFSLVKPGGHMIVLVPDEDLYEQGAFPSLFNSDHKFTFALSKSASWSPKSINVLDLVKSIPCELVSVELQDHGYDRSLLRHQAGRFAVRLGKLAKKMSRRFPKYEIQINKILWRLGAVIDQTNFAEPRLAQIQVIVRKPIKK